MERSKRIFLILSLVLFSGLSILAWHNYLHAKNTFSQTIATEGTRLHEAYILTYEESLRGLQQIATFIASSERIQQLFLHGKIAVEQEGGGEGKSKAAYFRKTLFDELAPSWQLLTREFEVRQLHFHIAPGATSFLRVHKPNKFGDDLTTIRHIIVDTNNDKQPRTGFETGRVYSGLRAVVPVWATQQNQQTHIGALEVGTSFSQIFNLLDKQMDAGIAALLRKEHITDNMWNDAVKHQFNGLDRQKRYALEASSRPIPKELENSITDYFSAAPHPESAATKVIKVGNHDYATAFWPLQDYQDTVSDNDHAVGLILQWRDITNQVLAFKQTIKKELLFSIVSFFILEICLYQGLKLATQRIERSITNRTAHLDEKTRHFAQLANTDELTSLNNRRNFKLLLDQQLLLATNSPENLALVMIDIDHFKHVNDQYGHPSGDRVIQEVAKTLVCCCRQNDILGRYGGEELVMLLTDCQQAQVEKILERMRKRVAETCVHATEGQLIRVTISLGAAHYRKNWSASDLFEAADQQLYYAKKTGRNRVSIG